MRNVRMARGAILIPALFAFIVHAHAARFHEITFHHRGAGAVLIKITTDSEASTQRFGLPPSSSKSILLPDHPFLRIEVRHIYPASRATADSSPRRTPQSGGAPQSRGNRAPAVVAGTGIGLPFLSDIFTFTDLVFQTATMSSAGDDIEPTVMDEDAILTRPDRAGIQALAIGGLDVRVSGTDEALDECSSRLMKAAAARRARTRAILELAKARADQAGRRAALATDAAFLSQAEARLAEITRAPDAGGAFSEDMKSRRVTTRDLKLRSIAGRNAWSEYRAGRILSDELLRRWKTAGEETATAILREKDVALMESSRKSAQDAREMARRKVDQMSSLASEADSNVARQLENCDMIEPQFGRIISELGSCALLAPPTKGAGATFADTYCRSCAIRGARDTSSIRSVAGAGNLLEHAIRELGQSSFAATPRGRSLIALLATYQPCDAGYAIRRGDEPEANPGMHRMTKSMRGTGDAKYLRSIFPSSSDKNELEEEILLELDASPVAHAEANRRPKDFIFGTLEKEKLVADKTGMIRGLVASAIHAAQAGRYHVNARRCLEQEIDAWRAANEACRALGLPESADRPGQNGRSTASSNPAYVVFSGW